MKIDIAIQDKRKRYFNTTDGKSYIANFCGPHPNTLSDEKERKIAREVLELKLARIFAFIKGIYSGKLLGGHYYNDNDLWESLPSEICDFLEIKDPEKSRLVDAFPYTLPLESRICRSNNPKAYITIEEEQEQAKKRKIKKEKEDTK